MSSFTELIKDLYFSYFAKPASDRQLYRAVQKRPFSRFVEIGLGDLARTQRLLSLTQRLAPEASIQYTGIDLFEAREAECSRLTLKGTHQQLKASTAKVKLVPGDAFSALARSANSLAETDLLLISSDVDEETYQRVSFYLPRMVHESSLVYREMPRDGDSHWELIAIEDIQRLSSSSSRRAA